MSASSSAPEPSANRTVAPEDVLQQLERILAHPLFQKSARLSTFLRYTVEATLTNESASLKETVIGAEVFKLGDSFDPQTDNLVRVTANRLRSKLAEYYHRSGRPDRVVIDLPKGRYVPTFSYAQSLEFRASGLRSIASLRTSVGRQAELDRMRSAFVFESDGAGRMLAISGEAGMGKTTIVEDFLAEIEAEQAAVWIARGRCSERLAKSDAFAPIFECLDSFAGGKPGSEAARLMMEAAPTWYAQIYPEAGGLGSKASGQASQERMRREFVRFFETLSPIRPIILFLDDMHWADASTCELLAYLGSRMKNLRMLIVTTYRPSELLGTHPFLAVRLGLERSGACQEIPLEFLSLRDIDCYLDRRFPGNAFPAEFGHVVQERTEGSPLFMRDMLSFLLDKGVLVHADSIWRLAQDVSEIRKVIPTGSQNMIRLQIEQFTTLDRKILQCAATQGVEFDSEVISRALSMDAVEVEERLQALERVHRFVQSIGDRTFQDRIFSTRYRFIHVFYQNALYADLAPTRRAAHSLAVARALVGLNADTGRVMAAEVALLFECGRDDQRAADYFLRAARYALAVFAYPEAAILCERGLKALRCLAESRERDAQELKFSLMLGLAQMATCGFAAPEVEKIHRRSRELCLRLNEKGRLVGVLWGIHTCVINAGELVPALELAKEMRLLADELSNPTYIMESLHALGTTHAFMGNLSEARAALERIFIISPIDRYRVPGSPYLLDTCVTSLSMLARVLARQGNLDEAMERARASVNLADRLAHPPSLAYATFWMGWVRHARGEYAEACSELETAMSLSRRHGLPQMVEWGRVVRGSSLAHLGRVAEGISEMRTSLDNQLAMRSLLERGYCLTLLAEALLVANEYPEALVLCEEALQIARETQGRSYEVETDRIRRRGLALLKEGGRSAPIA